MRKKSRRIKAGYKYEKWCAWYLRLHLWHFVSVTKKSNDYGADIIAYSPVLFRKTVIQCKHYKNPVDVSAVQQVLSARCYYRAKRAIVMTNKDYTRSARKLAERCDVELLARKGMIL